MSIRRLGVPVPPKAITHNCGSQSLCVSLSFSPSSPVFFSLCVWGITHCYKYRQTPTDPYSPLQAPADSYPAIQDKSPKDSRGRDKKSKAKAKHMTAATRLLQLIFLSGCSKRAACIRSKASRQAQPTRQSDQALCRGHPSSLCDQPQPRECARVWRLCKCQWCQFRAPHTSV